MKIRIKLMKVEGLRSVGGLARTRIVILSYAVTQNKGAVDRSLLTAKLALCGCPY